jgi:hypothetical protein
VLARKRHLRRYFCLENSHLRNAKSYFKGYKNALHLTLFCKHTKIVSFIADTIYQIAHNQID